MFHRIPVKRKLLAEADGTKGGEKVKQIVFLQIKLCVHLEHSHASETATNDQVRRRRRTETYKDARRDSFHSFLELSSESSTF